MNPKTTETPNIEIQTEEKEAPRPWVTPAFERVPLNEALSSPPALNFDGGGGWSS